MQGSKSLAELWSRETVKGEGKNLCGWFGVRREERHLEQHCIMIRDCKINQRHIIHTEPMGEYKIKGVTFDVAWLPHILS